MDQEDRRIKKEGSDIAGTLPISAIFDSLKDYAPKQPLTIEEMNQLIAEGWSGKS
jgi:hypothetical protein